MFLPGPVGIGVVCVPLEFIGWVYRIKVAGIKNVADWY